MKQTENSFYETANLPKSPYQTLTANTQVDQDNVLPIWPPKPNSFKGVPQAETMAKTGHNADDFINELITLNQKRRGIQETPSKTQQLDLSSFNLTSPKYR